MMFAPLASVFQFGSLLEWASHTAVIAFMLSHVKGRIQAEREPLEELTFRLRHPVKYAMQHPLKAIKRRISKP